MRSRASRCTVLRGGMAALLSACLITVSAVASAASTPRAEPVRLARQWASAVEGTDAYISLFMLNNRQAGAYLADGADIATLVLGERDGDALALRPNEGTAVTATVDGSEVTGTVTIEGVEHQYTATRATGDGGWYRGLKNSGGQKIAAGFIVLEDGSARGAIRVGDEVVATPEFDPDDLVLDIPGDGTIKVLPVAGFVKKHQSLDPGGVAASAALGSQVPSPYASPPSQAERTFVIGDTSAPTWLAVVIQGDHAIGYACDGAGVWGTLTGAVDDGRVSLTGTGSTRLGFTGTVDGDALTGRFTVGDDETDQTLGVAQPSVTGLYRVVDGDDTTWWIQTSAGLKGATVSTNGRRGRAFATSDASGFNSNTAAGAGEAP